MFFFGFFEFLKSNFCIFWSKMGFSDSLLNLFKGGRGGVAKCVFLCIFFNNFVKAGLSVNLKKFKGGAKLNFWNF